MWVADVVKTLVFLGHTCTDVSVGHDQVFSSDGHNRIPCYNRISSYARHAWHDFGCPHLLSGNVSLWGASFLYQKRVRVYPGGVTTAIIHS